MNKTFISSKNNYMKFNESGWNTVSSAIPTLQQFQDEGMDDISLLNRSIQGVSGSPFQMVNEGALGEGKLFKRTVDLNKYFDLRKLEVK